MFIGFKGVSLIKKFLILFLTILTVIMIPFSAFAEPVEIPGYEVVYSNDIVNDNVYVYVPVRNGKGKFEYGVTDLIYLPLFPKKFFEKDYNYVIIKSGKYYYLCFHQMDKNLFVDYRAAGQLPIIYCPDYSLKVYQYDSTQYVEGWNFYYSGWGFSVPTGSQILYSSTVLKSNSTGQIYFDKSSADYVYITLALVKFQKFYYDYIVQLVPIGVTVFASLIILRIFKKRKHKPKNKVKRRLPHKWQRKL